MEVARRPHSLSDVLETNGCEGLVAVVSPVSPGVGVPAQGDPQATNWAAHPLPARWPLVLWEDDPKWGCPLNSDWRYAWAASDCCMSYPRLSP